jgi:antirestriction protein ArdC
MAAKKESAPFKPEWAAILVDAVSKPGVISEAYSRFWDYSTGNQLLALFQCMQRGIELGPINTLLRWNELGRSVRKGEKALTLCMPVMRKRNVPTAKESDTTVSVGDGAERQPEIQVLTRFVYRPNWFVLSQTKGKEYVPVTMPEWQESTALTALGIERINFTHPNGNAQGYAVEKKIAVSPIAFMPHRTLFHEIAHVVLGHTEELRRMDDDEHTPVNLREVEAECVALICSESLKLDGATFSRGYIQHWLKGETIPERSAQRIFKAADQVLRSGAVGVLFTSG